MGIISAIIVNYNGGAHLSKSVLSLLKNSRISEIIVVDNNSRDSSLSSLVNTSKSQKIKIIRNKSNIGFAKAVNKGVKISKSDHILLINPDLFLESSAIDALYNLSLSKGDAVIAPRLINPDGSIQPSCFRRQSLTNAAKEYLFGLEGSFSKYVPSVSSPTLVWCAAAAAWIMPRSTWDKMNGFNEKFFLYFEDIDFCRRASGLGIPIIYVPHILATHRHGLSASTNPRSLDELHASSSIYHGKLKKRSIDLIIKLSRLFSGRSSLRNTFIIFLLWLLFSKFIASLGYFTLPSRLAPLDFIKDFWQSNFLLWSHANFDGEHYLSIAEYGYSIRNSFPQYAFFPLFPLLISLLSMLTHDIFLSGILLSHLFSFIFLFYLIKWINLLKLKRSARIIFFTLLFPGSYFLQAIYTESLFLALSAFTLYHTVNKNWLRASIAVGFATAARINGLALVVYLGLELVKSRISRSMKILYIFTSLSGILFYMAYLYNKTGSAIAFFLSQSSWGKSTATSPVATATRYFRALTTDFIPDLTHTVVFIEVVITIFMLYLLYLAFKNRRSPSILALTSITLALPLATGSLGSMPRFAILAFPLFTLLESFPRRIYLLTLTFSTAVFIFGTILFVRGYWYA